MSYKRRSRISSFDYDGYYGDQPTKIIINWSTKSSAYAIKFNDTKHWNEMQIFIQYMKMRPYGEYEYDPDNKIWYLHEKHLPPLLEMIRMIPTHFTLDYTEKPPNTSTHQFIPVDVYIDKFKELTTLVIKDIEYNDAKKLYRRWMIKNHPDVGGNTELVSKVNEVWTALETNHFKVRKEPEYA